MKHLNKAQEKAVLYCEGPMLISAGAGSGKTRAIIEKVLYLISEKNIFPSRILGLTFSNKAAKEMQERISQKIEGTYTPLITTFHSFCVRVLRAHAQALGLSKNFTIYTDSETKALAKQVLSSQRGQINPQELLDFIESCKNKGYWTHLDWDKRNRLSLEKKEEKEIWHALTQSELWPFFVSFEAELLKSNAVDFGGLITGVLQLFGEYPDILKGYQEKYEYILVDEYQDTNRAQFLLISSLASLKKKICVVGDEDQTIYSWRGANFENFQDFSLTFPEYKEFLLEQNYRSSQQIIQAASEVIAHNQYRRPKKLWTENEEGTPIVVAGHFSDFEEARWVAERVSDLLKKGEDPYEISIFYRNNYQSRLLEDALREKKIAYRIVAGIRFYERKEIKDILSYLQVIYNPNDSLSLVRVINIPTRGIGTLTIKKLEGYALEHNLSLWATVSESSCEIELKLTPKIQQSLRTFVSLIKNCQKILEEQPSSLLRVFDYLYENLDYSQYLKNFKAVELKSRLENIQEFRRAIEQFCEKTERVSLGGFLENLSLDGLANIRDEGEKKEKEVSLMTIHASKGLEFFYVFLTGVEENVFPSARSLYGIGHELEEERRLFYVAMTRAMKGLNISYSECRGMYGQQNYNGASRFIKEIPSRYIKHVGNKKKVMSDEDEDEEKIEEKQTIGTWVEHPLYGKGKVLKIQGIGTEAKVTIRFSNGAEKKFYSEYLVPCEI